MRTASFVFLCHWPYLENLISLAEYSSGDLSGNPKVNSVSSPCFDPLQVGQGSTDDWWL